MSDTARTPDPDPEITTEHAGKPEPSLPPSAKARGEAAEVKVQPTPATGRYAAQGDELEDSVEEGQEIATTPDGDA